MDKEIKELTREIYNNYNCRLYESTAENILDKNCPLRILAGANYE